MCLDTRGQGFFVYLWGSYCGERGVAPGKGGSCTRLVLFLVGGLALRALSGVGRAWAQTARSPVERVLGIVVKGVW